MTTILTSGLFIFAPVIGYVSQYRDIQKTSNCDGFSTRVCLILLLSNILRCYFWIGKQFDITLLYQSIVMIIAQLVMLQLCISIKSRESVTNSKSRRIKPQINIQKSNKTSIIITDDNYEGDDENHTKIDNISNNNSGYFQKFWEWDTFSSYIYFLGGYSAFFLFLTTIYLYSPSYFEYLGTLSLTIESILGLPQLIQNYKKKSTKGLSLVLISSWFIGDLFKTMYFYFKAQPAQFIFCGTVQLIIDILITLQIVYYK